MPSFPTDYTISPAVALKRGDFVYLPETGRPALVIRESQIHRMVVDLQSFRAKSFQIDGHVFPPSEELPDIISRGSGWRAEVLSSPVRVDNPDQLTPGLLVRSRDGWFLPIFQGERSSVIIIGLDVDKASAGYPPLATFADWRIVFPGERGREPVEAFRRYPGKVNA